MNNKQVLIKITSITILLFLFSFIFVNISDFKLEFGFPIPFVKINLSNNIVNPIDYLKRTSIDILPLLLYILIYKYIYSIIYIFIKKIKNTKRDVSNY